MLITVCYVYLWVRFHKCYSVLIRNSLSRLSSGNFSFSFRVCSSSASAPDTASPTERHTAARRQPGPLPAEDNVFLQLGDKAVYVTEPQACDDLSKWTVLLGSSLVCGPRIESISFIIEAAGHRVGYHSPHTSNKKVLKWSDYCLPLARSPGQPFRAVAQASVDNFSRLGVAFIEDRLQLDNGLTPSKIIPVLIQESTLSELLEKQCLKTETPPCLCDARTGQGVAEPLRHHLPADCQHPPCRKGSLLLTPEVRRRLEERRGSEPLCGTKDPGPICDSEDRSLGNHHHMEGHRHHLHLSSCNECLELENSTILSVKYASAENIPDLPDDNSAGLDSGAETLDDVHDAKGFSGQSGGLDCNIKPPNILLYTGGCQERFQYVRQILSECINMEDNIIYPLQPQQALSDPWLDNTKLLILAEKEPLTPQLQTCFLTYLSQGGRVLGLASTLCPAGLCLEAREERRGRVGRLSFTREDSTELELSVFLSGKVYVRDMQGGGEVELWGELKGDAPHQRDMVVVRVTHGEDGGEAVLCQAHLEIAPDPQNLTAKGFDELKVSNALRYEVLTEILTSLGLSCELNQTPVPSPVHLLATSQEAKTTFVDWLRTRADQNGLLTLSKASFSLVSSSELQDGPSLPEGSVALVTNSLESQSWPQFSMETYRENLKTSLLGHTLLYAEVATSTMDLLQGLTLHLPKEVGLIAVAAQQSQGRGRGRNAWLSPLGCAMFTLTAQVELSSKLGQRIPFLQHLVALAAVEAVRTLPGYQDIDLRVKWPNDIYYSNLMKLGGVLVTSTVIGSTFHLLIGCGFNVTNSNPTMCINDLIQQHNAQHNCSLQPLRCDQLIARTVGCLEALIGSFQRGGADAVLPTYYNRWLHSGTRVRLWSEDGLEAAVVGLDHNGFLQVHNKEQGVVSVEPNGNSFDMLKNLVVIKQH
ncbi:LOW QUALITY PROTEIN: biotin--protein ligase [Anarrhichthys ocellatus]|uniref:LOW QUALITY PROTEIN: biotin--protein ligase n=1 Tax=Anarrhichthys ocellatus TaxID=433405 RepID=UPI0012ED3474|nr:LOW QUALITY PROTEIN: biotin--protein ligase [Anarrhichthys ocellatus]